MNALREDFCILGGRKALRLVAKKCMNCQRYDSKPFASIPALLPLETFREAAVFEVVRIDFAGRYR